jgi:predicted SAM-dependent methyltransferase
MKCLNLGCGKLYHNDFINIDFKSNDSDVIEHNLLNGIPLEDSSVDVVYHSHVLEHFTKNDGESFLKECFRVLNNKGTIRIVVPDLEGITREYLKRMEIAQSGNEIDRMNYEWIKLELIDQLARHRSGGAMLNYLQKKELLNEDYIISRLGQEAILIRKSLLKNRKPNTPHKIYRPRFKKQIKVFIKKIKIKIFSSNRKELSQDQIKFLKVGAFRLGGEVHQWMYDYYSLSTLLNDLGFTQIKRVDAFTSSIEDWKSYNLDAVDGNTRKPDSFFIEARK